MLDWKWAIHPTWEGLIRAIDGMNCGVLVEDVGGVIVYANHRILEWSGYSVEELEGKPVYTLVPEEFRENLDAERKRVLDGDQRARLSGFRRRDGRTFPVAVSPQVLQRDLEGDAATEVEKAVMALLFDLGEVQTARPVGATEGSLAHELSSIALKLQSMSFSAAIGSEALLPSDHPLLGELSAREKEILEYLVAGSRVPGIAQRLHISPHTVRNHLKAIYRKVEVSSQGELIELVRSLAKPESRPDASGY